MFVGRSKTYRAEADRCNGIRDESPIDFLIAAGADIDLQKSYLRFRAAADARMRRHCGRITMLIETLTAESFIVAGGRHYTIRDVC